MSVLSDLWEKLTATARSDRVLNENEKMSKELRNARDSIAGQLWRLKNPIGTTGHIPDNEAIIKDLEEKLREIDGLLKQFKR